jgi:hypothetical protein
MTPVRIRKHIESDTLVLPELRSFIGRTVEIVIEEPANVSAAAEFWAVASELPTNAAEFERQQEQFRRWRADPRFEAHWPTIDHLLSRDFEKLQKWAEVTRSVRELREDGYNFDAWSEQRAYDVEQAGNPRQ